MIVGPGLVGSTWYTGDLISLNPLPHTTTISYHGQGDSNSLKPYVTCIEGHYTTIYGIIAATIEDINERGGVFVIQIVLQSMKSYMYIVDINCQFEGSDVLWVHVG